MNEINLTQAEIKQKLTENEDIKGICVIQNYLNTNEAVMYISDDIFTYGFRIECNSENLELIKSNVDNEVLLYLFTDKDLQEAWIESYMRGGISEDRFDRRAEFHKFDVPHELFCIDRNMWWHLTDYFKGTPHEGHPEWMEYVLEWYKNHSF